MKGTRALLAALLFGGATLMAQSTVASIQSNGTATIPVKPDQGQLTVTVTTQGNTAQDAGQQNATQTTAVISALTGVVGNNGTVQTVSYSVSPRYNNATPPAIVGYSASNTIQVTTNDISNVGRLIDTANQAGATNVGNISFGLQNPDPAKQQALTQAAQQALAHASAIASGLGRKTGAVISAQEASSYAPVVAGEAGLAPTSTPVVAGTVTVYASVTVTVGLQ